MSEKDVTISKKQRNITFVNAKKEMGKTLQMLKSGGNEAALAMSRDKLRAYKTKLEQLSGAIASNLAETELDEFLQQSDDFDEQLVDVVIQADYQLGLIEKQRQLDTSSHQSSSNSSFVEPEEVSTLPKLVIQSFSGDTLKWREFWDSFNVAVHAKTKLSSVEKFQYLKSFLSGKALRIIEGYPLTADTYGTALEALKERYDNPEFSIFAHLDAMITMNGAGSAVEELQRVFDDCEAHIRSLVALGLSEDTFSRVFTPLVLSKLPRFIRIELHRRNSNVPWTLTNLRRYLKDEIAARQMGAHAISGNNGSDSQDKATKSKDFKSSNGSRKPKPASSLVMTHQKSLNTAAPKFPCCFCNEMGHFPGDCRKYATVDARKACLKDCCILCLRKGHNRQSCRCKVTKCRHCGEERSHHRSLCPKKFTSATQSSNEVGLNVHAKKFAHSGSLGDDRTDNFVTAHQRVVLPTAIASIQGTKSELKVRIIFDSAATRSFARVDVLKQIGAKCSGEEFLGLAGIQAESRNVNKYSCYDATIEAENGEQIPLTVTALKTISCPVNNHAICASQYPVLSKISLADPLVNDSVDVQLDVLIGLDNFFRFVGSEQIRLDSNLVIWGTKLGYVLAGSASSGDPDIRRESSDAQSVLLAISESSADELDISLERLWRLEDVAVKDNRVDDSDTKAEQAFLDSVKYDAESHRYSVGWPWRSDLPELPDNFGLAYGRLKSLLSRLDGRTLATYDNIIRDQAEKSIIEVAPKTPDGSLVHYLPHHCVIRPDKATTKVRVVYDASSKSSKSALSLNDCLYRGPVLLADLCGLVLRFRIHVIGIVSDIEKAFLQVLLQRRDRDVTRFLWVKDTAKPPTGDNLVTFRFTRVLFGVKSSPYMLAGTIKHHLTKNNYAVSNEILDNCYVDNVIHGAQDVQAAKQYYDEAKSLFREAGMNLREWQSNCSEFISCIPNSDSGDPEVASVLGLKWKLTDDALGFASHLQSNALCSTKREILRAVASVFDPLGLLSPVSICGKILLQKLWECPVDWDSKVPNTIQQQWNSFYPELVSAQSVLFPRSIGLNVSEDNVQLHCFCDASKAAYSAAVYVRSVSKSIVTSNLVFAKAKVTPIKSQQLTIPRLELTALALGCQILVFVQKEMRLKSCDLFAWTDSQCSLHWVNKCPKSPIYVKNRVTLIRSYDSIQLRFVPTESNPADLPTRGMKTSQLMSSDRWWKGPDWLINSPCDWPAMPELPKSASETSDDVQCSENAASVFVANDERTDHLDPRRFSSLQKLLRVTAWVKRFIHNARNKECRSGELLASEKSDAQTTLIKMAQQDFVLTQPDRFRQCESQLKLFDDSSGLLRCRGRLDNAELPYDARYPIFLPVDAGVSKLMVTHLHNSLAHAGVQHVLATLRTRFWLPKGRSAIKRIIHDCRLCKRLVGGSFKTPTPPPLPAFRAEGGSCFTSVGVDYLGPLMIRSPSSGSLKTWICLFTCCNTRAIHLEVIEDMTVEQFVLCLRRFIASYGAPKLIVCDNAKQFHAAKKTTDRLWKEATRDSKLRTLCTDRGIEWKLIVEFAPWFGGFYERMVGLVKKALRSVLYNQLLTLVELQTVCAEVGYIVNSRPLTYCEDEVGNSSLCPNDFISRSRSQFPSIVVSEQLDDPDFNPDSGAALRMKWKRLDHRLNAFWDQWRRQYLVALREQTRHPGNRGSAPEHPSVGTVVLVKVENLPRSRWMIGRIVEVVSSGDGVVRSAKVKLSTGKVVHRPLKLLFPIEVSEHFLTQSQGTSASDAIVDDDQSKRPAVRPQRASAIQARRRWREDTGDSENDSSTSN